MEVLEVNINTKSSNNENIIDYSNILLRYGLNYINYGNYYKVGNHDGDITLHISIVISQLSGALEKIIPIFIEHKISFSIVKDYVTAKSMQAGYLGYEEIGKTLIVNIKHSPLTSSLTDRLVNLTNSFNGPKVHNEILIGNVIYSPISQKELLGLTEPDMFDDQFAGNKQYKVINILSKNAKGNVLKGIRYKGFFPMGFCIIKEGKKDMWSDNVGKSIRDRLLWQKEVHAILKGHVKVPKIFDFFDYKGNAYLVTSYIDGQSLNEIIVNTYKNRYWKTLNKKEKVKILDLLSKVIDEVISMHKRNIVHRDLSPINFLINKTNELFIIDFELSYNVETGYPEIPFGEGTKGFMSPEQLAFKKPSFKEDIYGLGALMIFTFTNLLPIKFNTSDTENLVTKIDFFIGNKNLANTIAKCVDKVPEKRPTLLEIKEMTSDFKLKIYDEKPASSQIIQTVSIGSLLDGLRLNEYLTKEKLFSIKGLADSRIGNKEIYSTGIGLSVGITGILYLLSKDEYRANSTEKIRKLFNSIIDKWGANLIPTNLNDYSGALLDGSAGLAIAIACTQKLGGLLTEKDWEKIIFECFQKEPNQINIYYGAAGQLLALLEITKYSELQNIFSKLDEYTEFIIKYQKEDGSWPIFRTADMKTYDLGLATGISGIIYALLKYYEIKKSEIVRQHIQKGLNWLQQQSNILGEKFYWPLNIDGHYCENLGYGCAGIAVAFITAYKCFRDTKYKKIAEGTLNAIQDAPVWNDFSLSSGIAGVGLAYVYAENVIGNSVWAERAKWVNQLLYNASYGNDPIYWRINHTEILDPNLLTGTSGIILFLNEFNKLQKK